MKTEKFTVTGMTCAACQANITKGVSKLSGVKDVNVSLLGNRMTVEYDESGVTQADIIGAVTAIGYGAASLEAPGKAEANDFRSEWQQRKKSAEDGMKAMKLRLVTSIVLLIPLMYVAMGHMVGLPMPAILTGEGNLLVSALTQLVITVPVMVINKHFYTSGFKALFKRSPNMDSLVAIGSCAALLYGLFSLYCMAYGYGHGDTALVHKYAHELYFESAAMIVTLVTVGKYLEARSKSKTSDALGKLVDLAPKTAVVVRNGAEAIIPAEQVIAGDVVVIRPGESIPVDGVVTEGYGYVDQAAITGESIPVDKREGDTVISATINKNGSFKFVASKVGGDTTLAQIIRLVDEASNTKAPIARLADKISGVFVPIVILIAIVTAAAWMIAGYDFDFALSCAIAVLVISCPCALGLATPVAIMVGTGKAAEYGILIKSAESLENLHSVDTVVLDKTGTITSGHPSVTDVVVLDGEMTEGEFLREAASVEQKSEHPLAQAVVIRAKENGATLSDATDFESTSGRGVRATVDGKRYIAGNLAFMEESGLNDTKEAEKAASRLAKEGKTPLLFAADGKLAGVIAVADTIRDTSREAVKRFAKMGLHVVMLTGDNRVTAEAIRDELGIEEAISDVLPTQKEAVVRALQDKGHKVAMVGDGINDAPALTRADIGIAIGAGTDIAIESADVVLMKDTLLDVATAIELSKSVVRNIKMNLFWAFFYNVLGIPVAAGALFIPFAIKLSPMIGSAAMSLSSVCVVANALRLRFFKSETQRLTQVGQRTPEAMAAAAVETVETVDTQNQIKTTKEGNEMRKTLKIEGMMCNHCKMHVEKALTGVDGVSAVEVSLSEKQAVVTLATDVSDKALTDAVTEAGYEVVGIN